MKSCGMSCIKCLLFGFNFLFAISGIGIIAVGAIALSSAQEYENFDEGETTVPSILLVVTGVIIFIVAFVGCYGAFLESYCMLITFAVFLLIIFIIELAAGISAAVVKGDMAADKFQESLQKYSTDEKQKAAWDSVQSKLMCCGVKGPSDWGNSLPVSCCRELPEGSESENAYCSTNAPEKKFLSSVGCLDKLQMGIKTNSRSLIGVGIGFAFIEVLGIVLACWLAAVIKKESKLSEPN